MSDPEELYYRISVEATLITGSVMHCGNGGSLDSSEWESKNSPGTKGIINTVCKDQLKKPYIPASTLRGSMRDICSGEMKNELFGCPDDNKRQAGKLRFYDAKWKSTPEDEGDYFQHAVSRTSLHDGVKIDPITNTAADKQLFTHEVVPAESQFSLRIEGDNISETELKKIMGLVQAWDGEAASAIGKGKSRGWGRIRTSDLKKPEIIDSQGLASWLKSRSEEALPWKEISVSSPAARPQQNKNLSYVIELESPLLINEKKRVERKTDDNHPADFEFMRNNEGQAYIPGSSIRGAVRSHATRILATIAHTKYGIEARNASNIIRPLIDELFGTTGKRSPLWFEDVVAENTATHPQTFNAVDRFTGGVADTALYKANALAPTTMRGVCYLDTHIKRTLEGDWWKGLLLLLIRDFMEGDLSLGWGKAKGYGQARIYSLSYGDSEIKNFLELATLLGDNATNTLALLRERLDKLLVEDKQS